MNEPTRLLIHGASGRMGQALIRLARERDDLRVVAAAARSAPDDLPAGATSVTAASLDSAPDFDVAIDFSLPEAFDAVLDLCVRRRVPLVSGTTGLSDAQRAAIDAAAMTIPVVWAANFSLGVAVLGDLVERAAKVLAGWDCDIVEAHHIHKKDAPSGTALALGARAEAGGASPHYASLRAGDIVGEHTVQFATAGERIELVHRATNRDIFARGALHVARRLHGRAPGAYRVGDLLD
ncbi:4-hydroxy-tetrahydrodipicolinate reductase [Cognatilysobacter terrigena]|uniref:4-hydroxy-tetrahydrodipicolinate reductase n=1 Tax=Cognatilysobacter terrigena TaxID=2488749 RepID=UPI0010619D58|nr:4-hydroxy-tetrahydrodipicolinate reductase [Lysobacter terrigena]